MNKKMNSFIAIVILLMSAFSFAFKNTEDATRYETLVRLFYWGEDSFNKNDIKESDIGLVNGHKTNLENSLKEKYTKYSGLQLFLGRILSASAVGGLSLSFTSAMGFSSALENLERKVSPMVGNIIWASGTFLSFAAASLSQHLINKVTSYKDEIEELNKGINLDTNMISALANPLAEP